MKFTFQNFIILMIIDALKNTSYGQGIRILHEIKITRGPQQSCIEFIRKDGKEIKFNEFFMMALLCEWTKM